MFKIIGKGRKNFRVRLSDKSITLPVLDLTEEVRTDKDMWTAFRANIACSFSDAIYWRLKNEGRKYLRKDEIWEISNEAAENFLKLWTS